jgi:hypothetical protein
MRPQQPACTIPGPPTPVVCSVAVALEDPFEISKEPFGPFPFTPEPEIEHDRFGWLYCQR